MTTLELLRISPAHIIVLFGILGTDSPNHVGDSGSPYAAVSAIISSVEQLLVEQTNKRGIQVTATYCAMTHQTVRQDQALARRFPQISLVMGGHDHNVVNRKKVKNCLIVKSASNARTLRLNWVVAVPLTAANGQTLPSAVDADLLRRVSAHIYKATVGDSLRKALLPANPTADELSDFARIMLSAGAPNFLLMSRVAGHERIYIYSLNLNTEDAAFIRLLPAKQSVVDRISYWNSQSKHSDRTITVATIDWIVEDATVRRFSTNFGNFIADIVRGGVSRTESTRREAEIGFINSGSFRIDRNIRKGESISARTLCDIFFHSNEVLSYRVTGSSIINLIRATLSLRNRDPIEGDGNFLQISGLRVDVRENGEFVGWLDRGLGSFESIIPEREYCVATTAYVATKAFPAFFNERSGVRLDADLKMSVSTALEEMNSVVLDVLLRQRPRWIFNSGKR